MTEKGNAYPRTRWQYGERPVTAAKLNAWDDHIAHGLALAYRLINEAFGGGDGVLTNALEALQTAAMTPPTLAVQVRPGYAFIAGMPFVLPQPAELLPVTPPQNEPRHDLVQARLDNWAVDIKEGVEAAQPATPEPDENCLPLAILHLRPGMTVIKNTDDTVNGYIVRV